MLKILLVAPTDPVKPSDLKLLVGGENTFTKSLLENSPEGIEYILHFDAEKKGLIEYTFLHYILSFLVKLRILPLSGGSQVFKLKSDFDLIHCHAYSIKVDKRIPIVLSDSSSNYLFLRDYLNWSRWRIRLGLAIKKLLFNIFNVLDSDINIGNSRLIVFSEFAKKVHLKLGAPKQKIEVIYPGIPAYSSNEMRSKKFSLSSNNNDTMNILFVGIWFERKGGHLLLEAYRQLSEKYENLKLTIVGPIPKDIKKKILNIKDSSRLLNKFSHSSSQTRLRSNNIVQFDYVPRERLMREFFPKADIFVLVPPKVEGFGFVVLEAMAFGIPTVVSNVCALPELINDGTTGFIVKPGSLPDLIKKLEMLIVDGQLRKKIGAAGRASFLKDFSTEVMNKKLVKIYKSVLENA